MDDRTMLELAAKAMGLDAAMEMYGRAEDGSIFCDANDPPTEWNPLQDDGDAFRLASVLHINIEFVKGLTTRQFVEISAYPSGRGDCLCIEPIGDGPNHAARRAITRAAAEIQLAKESK